MITKRRHRLVAALLMALIHSAAFARDYSPQHEPNITLTLPDAPRDAHSLTLTISPDNNNSKKYEKNVAKQQNPKPQHSKNEKKQTKKTNKYHQNTKHAYQSGPFEITGVKIVDINSGRVMPINKVNLKPTLERIAAGIKNPHRNDGSIFRNSSHHLPRKPRNYYREYVVPTDGIRGPGPQRIIIGQEGEIYYTYDHYESFIKVERE